jgi:hypothetical protein
VTEARYFGQGGELLEQCDVCACWFPVRELIRQTHIRRRHKRDNGLYASRYDTNHWQIVGADYLGQVSMGRSRVYWKPHPFKNANIADGAHSFWGDAELIATDAIDLSGYCTALLRGRFGTHQATRQPGLTIEFGFYYDYGGAGQTRYSIGTRTINTHTAWVVDDLSSIAPAHLTALEPFYKITTYDDQQVWWGEDFRLQKDATEPGMTTAVSRGTPVDDDFQMVTFGKAVVCPEHRQYFEKRVNEYQPTTDDVYVVEEEDEEW